MQEIAPFVRILGCYPADRSNSLAPSPFVETPNAGPVTEQMEAGLKTSPESPMGANGSGAGSELLITAATAVRPIQQVTFRPIHPHIM